jgi:NleD-like pathogen effector protein (putative zinc metallopeptidase)
MATLSATGYAFIFVFNDDAKNPYFRLTVEDALNQINSQAVGQQLLTAISGAGVAAGAGGFKVKIVRPDVKGTIGTPGAEGGSRAVPFNEAAARGGAGCLAACYWNPNIYNTPSAAGGRPAYIGLAHELVHCMHALLGTMKNGYDDEEKFTVGLAPYAAVAICENTIRAEHNIAVRTSY